MNGRGLKRYPYAYAFNSRMSAEQIKASRKRYRAFSKADLLDVFADMFRQCEVEENDRNIMEIMDEIERRRFVMICADQR